MIQFEIQKETEKAYSVKLVYCLNENSSRSFWNCWLPKSQVTSINFRNGTTDVVAEIPEWLMNKIGNDILNYFHERNLNPKSIIDLSII